MLSAPYHASHAGLWKQEDEEAEYEAWKVREMARIARDREEKRREAAEAEERERLKHMTDEERRQWERDHPKARTMTSFNDVCTCLTITSARLLSTSQVTVVLVRLETRIPRSWLQHRQCWLEAYCHCFATPHHADWTCD